MIQPKTYLDRMGRKKNNYVFISYSHKDAECVFDVLQSLFEADVNYWYDAELTDGQVWNEEVPDVIASPDCVGAIFFLSENSIVSNAVCQEVQAVNSRVKTGDGRFKILPVLIGLKSYQEMLAKLVVSSAYKSVEDYAALMKNGDRTFIRDDASAISRLVSFSERIGASEKGYVEIRDTNFSIVDAKKIYWYECGAYPATPAGELVPIRWKLISRKDNLLSFVSEYCLDFVEYENACIIDPRRFGLSERAEVVSLRLMDRETLEQYGDSVGRAVPTDYADFKRAQSFRAFWVKGEGDSLLLYNSLNKDTGEIPNPENDMFTAGIRLMLVIDDKKISVKE